MNAHEESSTPTTIPKPRMMSVTAPSPQHQQLDDEESPAVVCHESTTSSTTASTASAISSPSMVWDTRNGSGTAANTNVTTSSTTGTPTNTTRPAPITTSLWRTSLTILTWYILSNSIILTTKWLFEGYFPFPLTVTFYSNVVASLWAAGLSWRCVPPQQRLTRHLFTRYVLPIGLTTALEIGCSNLALEILTVSFGTILKGLAPLFTFLWGLTFGLEQFSYPICACLIAMATGITLATLGEGQEFQIAGFTLQLFSTCLSGLRWATTHKLLQGGGASHSANRHHNANNNSSSNTNHDGTHSTTPTMTRLSPLTATLYTAPTTSLCILPVALLLEGRKIWQHETSDGIQEIGLVISCMTTIATLIFGLIMSEYWLVSATSSLALSVAAVLKELLTIGGGILFFADHVDALNVVGFSVCQGGILAYVCLRYDKSAMSASSSYTAVDTTTNDGLESHLASGDTLAMPHALPPSYEKKKTMDNDDDNDVDDDDDDAEESFVDEAANLEMPAIRHRLK